MTVLISDIEGLPRGLRDSVSPEEAAYIETIRDRGGLPFGVSSHFASLAGPDKDDPIRRQFFPDPREALPDPFALEDPLGEWRYRAAPRLTHQYRDRALLLAGGSCAGYCRYCFRRVWMAASAGTFIGEGELAPALAYLGAHPEIREILLSGGDPLTAEDGALEWLFGRLREARPGVLLRLCSRAPVTEPSRIGAALTELLIRSRPLRLVVHINHPRELAPPARRALASCVDAGIPVHVQTVLLRGINDRAETLEELFRECLNLGLSPYYLFQLDLAPGTRHFRVPLKEGLAVYQKLRLRISGLALPSYAVDLPGGGGKITLHGGSIAGEGTDPRGRIYLLRGREGELWPYPAD
ncbi:MAG: KamA family radical SAM protein [Treponema sp.]|nr:KamA family radical SAM protein [Treponema sp.]